MSVILNYVVITTFSFFFVLAKKLYQEKNSLCMCSCFPRLCRWYRECLSSVSLSDMIRVVFLSCASVFPESPRWLLATAQIPQVKKSLQEFSTRNGVCLQDEIYPGETLLSGMHTQTQTGLKVYEKNLKQFHN